MFELTIEQKVLLAEKVMGWGILPIWDDSISIEENAAKRDFDKSYYFPHGENLGLYKNGGQQFEYWQPETDEGDAARLLMSLPYIHLDKLDDEIVKISVGGWSSSESPDFCTAVCLVALQYAGHKARLQNEQ